MRIEDKPQHECGIIGVFAPNEDIARMAFFGLFALQHRGQEAAGIAVSDGATMRVHKEVGLVSQVFNEHNLAPLRGHYAIGHTRYSTTGSSIARNAQPFVIETLYGSLAVAHNGNLVNAYELRQQLEANGSIFQTTVDSEIILHLLARATNKHFDDDLVECLRLLKGAFSLLFLTERELI
ncbi:MAG TPA: class II glutamine amidotransferase, partial [Anaerolineae bacterium]|nr:class II glutamine amidotransferase [Anaerolineae bacterium]